MSREQLLKTLGLTSKQARIHLQETVRLLMIVLTHVENDGIVIFDEEDHYEGIVEYFLTYDGERHEINPVVWDMLGDCLNRLNLWRHDDTISYPPSGTEDELRKKLDDWHERQLKSVNIKIEKMKKEIGNI